ncbi:MAG: hypothetical protein GX851_07740 [Clostridiales bacterium]|nr:hypothetical protein [Clostridiales bacterium]
MDIFFEAKRFPAPKPISFGNIQSRITVNTQHYMLDGKPKIFVACEFHFERYPREFWEEEILKLKAGGIDVISCYIIWLFHEPKPGKFCFEGDLDDGYFLSLCKKHSMRVIMRIGPYAHGELRHGGLPDFVFRLPYNRSNHPKYLALAERYWRRLYENTKEFFDGETVVGIQLENEYTKGFDHLLTLRNLAEKIGFKTPVFTVTGWGFTFDNNDLQGTYGGYAARPWARHTHRMPVHGDFTIREAFHDFGIGDDVIMYSRDERPVRAVEQPNFTCECGCGNQVTEHRREIISTKDAFGVPFATVANGCNWLGYYMYHGSSNPRGGLFQESRFTLSPNNCPVIDYDFQAPLGRFGYPKESFKRLKSLNYFLQYFGDSLAQMQKFYSPQLNITEDTDAVTPRVNIRINRSGNGFVFITSYDRDAEMPELHGIKLKIETQKGTISLPAMDIKSGEFVMYPFGITLGGVKYDYIIASPVARMEKDGVTTFFFKTASDLPPSYSTDGKTDVFRVSSAPLELQYHEIDKTTRIVVLSEELSDDFYIIDGKAVFTNAVVYGGDGITVIYKRGDFCVIDGKTVTLDAPAANAVAGLKRVKPFKCRYGRYLFGKKNRSYYDFTAENLVFSDKIHDYVMDFGFDGSVLQMYSDGVLVNDFFNFDGKMEISLRYFKNELSNGKKIQTAVSPFSSSRKNYTEKAFPKDRCSLVPERITAYYRTVVR